MATACSVEIEPADSTPKSEEEASARPQVDAEPHRPTGRKSKQTSQSAFDHTQLYHSLKLRQGYTRQA